jgi:DNA invertase Pin-like site-specific DNA recombinase
MMGAFAEFERAMILERTTKGLARARERGVRMGRPPKLTKQQVQHCREQIDAGTWTKADAARFFDVSRSTMTRTLQRHEDKDS